MSTSNNSQSTLFSTILHKFLVVAFCTICILGTAASCSLNPFGGKESNISTLGMLKLTTESPDFQKLNAVTRIDGKTEEEGLSGLSVVKVKEVSADTIFIQTVEKGLFKTTNGGADWSRIYIFPVEYTEDKEAQKTLEAQLLKNEEVLVKDFWVSPQDNNVIYIAAKHLDQGKIFKTTDGGKTVREVYFEINDTGSSVDYVVIDPVNEDRVYALLNGKVLIQTLDAGSTWQKMNNYNKEDDTIVQIGLLADNRTMFILYEKGGLSGSVDGNRWVKITLNKLTPPAPKNPNQSIKETAQNAFNNIQETIAPEIIEPFSKYTRFTPLGRPNSAKKPAIVLADKEIWLTADLGKSQFIQMTSLPIQDKKIDVQDVQVDISGTTPKIYVAIGNKILVSENNGNTWANKPIGIEGIGSISNIVFSSENPDTIYLSLYNPKSK
jgi:photosystem II stability/assembly factor-like uncharacterized protein